MKKKTIRLVGVLGIWALAPVLSGCGLLPGSAPAATPTTAPVPTVAAAAASVSPTAARAAVQSTASPAPTKPSETPVPAAASNTVWVGNTDGEGVYVRKTPVMADRLKPYADGTPLTVVGDDVDGDGQHWRHIKTPDGLEGYVPSIYTAESPP